MGAPYPGSAIDVALNDDDFTADRLLSAASDRAVDDLRALHAVALDSLYPHLRATHREVEVHTEVTFEASSWCAEADAISSSTGTALEVKTRLGPKTPIGHVDALLAIDLYQALAYLLFDLDDRYTLRQLGWYSARYGNLAVFDVGLLLRTMADPHESTLPRNAHTCGSSWLVRNAVVGGTIIARLAAVGRRVHAASSRRSVWQVVLSVQYGDRASGHCGH